MKSRPSYSKVKAIEFYKNVQNMLLVLLGETNKVSMWQKSAGMALVKARCCVLRLVESAQ